MRIAIMLWGGAAGEPSLYREHLREFAARRSDAVVFGDDPDASRGELHYLRFGPCDAKERYDVVLHDIDDGRGYAASFPYVVGSPGVLFLGDTRLHRYARAVSHSPLDGWGFRWILGACDEAAADALARFAREGFHPGKALEKLHLGLSLARRSAAVVVPDFASWRLFSAADRMPPVSQIPPPFQAPETQAAARGSPGAFGLHLVGCNDAALISRLAELLEEREDIEITASGDCELTSREAGRADLLVFVREPGSCRDVHLLRAAIASGRHALYPFSESTMDIPPRVGHSFRVGDDPAAVAAGLAVHLADHKAESQGEPAVARRWGEQEGSVDRFIDRVTRMLPTWADNTLFARKHIEPLEHGHRDLPAVERSRVLERFHEEERALAEPVLRELEALLGSERP